MDEKELMVTLTDHENRIKSLGHRMDKAENMIEEIRNLNTSVQLMAQEQKNAGEKLDTLTNKVEKLDNQPKEAFNSLKMTVITSIITLVVGALVGALVKLL